MCGIVGIVGQQPVNQELYDALIALQHRGQDAAGIATCENNRLYARRSNGLVRDVFHMGHMLELKGNIGIGHVRYPTAGGDARAEAQPFYVNSPYGIVLGHNGNLVNAEELKRDLFRDDRRHINTESDSEVLLNVLAHELHAAGKVRVDAQDVFSAMTRVYDRCRGGYAAIAMIFGFGLVGFRDPHGIRPICFGRRDTVDGPEFMIASESVALDALGFELIRDLSPGEVICIQMDGTVSTSICANDIAHTPCIFEYVYLSRPDSIIDDISIYKARLRMGEMLASRILEEWPNHDIDVVIPIPDTSRTAALPLAYELGVKYREGFIKNRYIGRTFIMPGQSERKKSVRQKLNPIPLEFEGKNVLLVDDSIVRGTTSGEIIDMARSSGAKKVYLASAAPPVRFPNVYGIDMPTPREFVAHDRSIEEICEAIGADRLFYQRLDDLISAVTRGNPRIQRFDTSCFDGHYITGGVTHAFLAHQAEERSDEQKERRRATTGA